MSLNLAILRDAVAEHGSVVRVLVTADAGSAPRGAGTSMLVWAHGQDGTIGGGELEYRATQDALAMLAANEPIRHRTLPLGPSLGQCCGGSVTLVWERFDRSNLPSSLPFARPLPGTSGAVPASVARKLANLRPGSPPVAQDGWLIEVAEAQPEKLWIWGAGHVGREIVDILAPMPGYAITWVDTGQDRFPADVPAGVTALPAADPVLLAAHAPQDAQHIILTYSHDHDLKLCDALLRRTFGSCGVIGSATKWARFRSRLGALGHAAEQISRIACPIGDPALGKHPRAIALGVATSLMKQAETHNNRGTAGCDRHTA